MMHVGDIMSTMGGVQYRGGYHSLKFEYRGGYHSLKFELPWGIS